MLTLIARFFAGSLFRTAEGAVKSGWEWLFSSVTHLLEALLLGALLFGLWERHELHNTQNALASCVAGRKADKAEWNQQVLAAKQATEQAKQKGKDTADDAETYHTQLQADNHGLRDYVATHRLPQPAPSAPATADARSGDDSFVSAGPSPMSTVAVSEDTLAICDSDYTYAASAYELGQRLIQQGLAEPAK